MRMCRRVPDSDIDELMRDPRPDYVVGHSINIGMLVLSLILSTGHIMYVKWENGKRARGDRDHRLAEEDEGALGHLHPRFRYTI